MNSTTDHSIERLRTVSVWCFSAILIFGVLGNTTIIYIYGFVSRQRFNNFQRLLLTLALSDLLKTITGPPLYIYWNVRGFSEWDYGAPGCKLFPALWQYFTNISLGLIIVLILERSRARISAGGRQFNWIQISRALAMIIILSIFRFVPLMHHHEIEDQQCFLNRTAEFNITNISLIVFTDGVFLIFFIVSFACVKLHFFAGSRRLKRQNAGGSFTHTLDLDHTSEAQENARIVFRMATIFVFCVFPYDVFQLYISFSLVFKTDIKTTDLKETENILLIVNMLYTCVNIILYAISKPTFREDLVTHFPLFRWMQKRCCRESASSDAGSLGHLEIPSLRTGAGSNRRKGFDDSHHFSLMNN